MNSWQLKTSKRLIKAPKIYLRDSGITHALLGIRNEDDLLAHPGSGHSWEGFVLENLLTVAPEGTLPTFYRPTGGAEIDIVLTFPGGMTWAIEVKRSLKPKTGRGFYSAADDINPERQLVVYPGHDAFPVSARTTAMSLSQIINELAGL